MKIRMIVYWLLSIYLLWIAGTKGLMFFHWICPAMFIYGLIRLINTTSKFTRTLLLLILLNTLPLSIALLINNELINSFMEAFAILILTFNPLVGIMIYLLQVRFLHKDFKLESKPKNKRSFIEKLSEKKEQLVKMQSFIKKYGFLNGFIVYLAERNTSQYEEEDNANMFELGKEVILFDERSQND